MKAIGIKALKNDLSHYLRLVQEGELIFITDRNEIVAELRQPSTAYVSAISKFDSFMSELVRRGDGKRSKALDDLKDILDKTIPWQNVLAIDALTSTREDRDL